MKEEKEIPTFLTNKNTVIQKEQEEIAYTKSIKREKSDLSAISESDNESGKYCIISCKNKMKDPSFKWL